MRLTVGGLSGGDLLSTRTVVEVSSTLVSGADWVVLRYAWCSKVKRRALPGISEADVVWDYGRILREGGSGFSLVRPADVRGKYVRVRSRYRGGGSWVTRFVGYCPVESASLGGGDNGAMGRQAFRVVGLEWLLDRELLMSSMWLDGDSPVEVRGVSVFNEDGGGGRRVGNRSATRYGSVDEYVFDRSASAELWNGREVLEYALGWFRPLGVPSLELSGELEALEAFYPQVRVDGRMSLLGLVGALVDRRRGLGARLRWSEDGSRWGLEVFSGSDMDVVFGGFRLPANDARRALDVSSSVLVQSCRVVRDEGSQVGEVVVRGEPLRVTFTMDWVSETMVAGWAAATETAYREAGDSVEGFSSLPDTAKAVYADAIRTDASNNFLRPVYRKFKLDPDWDWSFPERTVTDPFLRVVGGLSFTDYFERVVPGCVALPRSGDDGVFDSTAGQPAPWRVRRFLRTTGIRKGYDYSVDPPVFLGDEEDDPGRLEVEAPMVFAMGTTLLDSGVVVQRLYEVTGGGESTWPKASVTPAEDELAVYVDGNPPHVFALNWFYPAPASESNPTPNANPTQSSAVVDWRSLMITAAVDSNEHVEFRRGTGVLGRTVLVDVDGMSVWWIAPGTVVGLEENGLPIRIMNEGGMITRDDRDWGRAVMALALSWYRRARAGLVVSYRGVLGVADVGDMVSRVFDGSGLGEDVWSVVSEVVLNFEGGGSTEVVCGWEDLAVGELVRDLMGGALGGGAGHGGSGGGGGAGSGGQVARGLRELYGNLPVRWPLGGGSGTGSGSSGGEPEVVAWAAVLGLAGSG